MYLDRMTESFSKKSLAAAMCKRGWHAKQAFVSTKSVQKGQEQAFILRVEQLHPLQQMAAAKQQAKPRLAKPRLKAPNGIINPRCKHVHIALRHPPALRGLQDHSYLDLIAESCYLRGLPVELLIKPACPIAALPAPPPRLSSLRLPALAAFSQ